MNILETLTYIMWGIIIPALIGIIIIKENNKLKKQTSIASLDTNTFDYYDENELDITTNKYELAQFSSHNILTEFNKFRLSVSSINGELSQKIDEILCSFHYESGEYSAYADTESDAISFNLFSVLERSHALTISHEFAHFVTFWAYGKLGHTLEFAIITYCLDFKFNGKTETFFRSYDIHQDKSYPYLSINPSQFDDFIKSIEWETLEELADKAKFLSEKIRKKQAFFSVKTWSEEYKKEVMK